MPNTSKIVEDDITLKGLYRVFALICALFSFVGLSFFLIYWFVNIYRAIAFDIEFVKQFLKIPYQLSTSNIFHKLSKDASTVTPLVGLIFFFYIFIASIKFYFKKMSKKDLSKNLNTFPFPLTYQETWIQLGLIGTLWGFIIIGGDMKPGADPAKSVTLLVMAFGTALLSTLAGVLGAYIFGPMTTSVFRRFIDKSVDLPQTPQLLDGLKSKINDLSTSIDAANYAVKDFAANLAKIDLRQLITYEINNLGNQIAQGLNNLGTKIEQGQQDLGNRINHGISGINSLAGEIKQEQGALAAKIDNGHSELSIKVEETQLEVVRDLQLGYNKVALKVEHGQNKLGDKIEHGINSVIDEIARGQSNFANQIERAPTVLETKIDKSIAEGLDKLMTQLAQRLEMLKAEIPKMSIELKPTDGRFPDSTNSTAKPNESSGILRIWWQKIINMVEKV